MLETETALLVFAITGLAVATSTVTTVAPSSSMTSEFSYKTTSPVSAVTTESALTSSQNGASLRTEVPVIATSVTSPSISDASSTIGIQIPPETSSMDAISTETLLSSTMVSSDELSGLTSSSVSMESMDESSMTTVSDLTSTELDVSVTPSEFESSVASTPLLMQISSITSLENLSTDLSSYGSNDSAVPEDTVVPMTTSFYESAAETKSITLSSTAKSSDELSTQEVTSSYLLSQKASLNSTEGLDPSVVSTGISDDMSSGSEDMSVLITESQNLTASIVSTYLASAQDDSYSTRGLTSSMESTLFSDLLPESTSDSVPTDILTSVQESQTSGSSFSGSDPSVSSTLSPSSTELPTATSVTASTVTTTTTTSTTTNPPAREAEKQQGLAISLTVIAGGSVVLLFFCAICMRCVFNADRGKGVKHSIPTVPHRLDVTEFKDLNQEAVDMTFSSPLGY